MATNMIRYDFEVKEREQLDVKIVMPREERGVVHGVVFDKYGRPIEDAVVKLFEVDFNDHFEKDGKPERRYELKPVTHAFTDEYGQFLFGPLCPKKKYSIKLWFNDVRCRCDVFRAHADRDCLKPCCYEHKDKDHKTSDYADSGHEVEIRTHLEVPAPDEFED